jgi:hypothetical protein
MQSTWVGPLLTTGSANTQSPQAVQSTQCVKKEGPFWGVRGKWEPK